VSWLLQFFRLYSLIILSSSVA